MIIKSLQYDKNYPMDDDILDNKILIIAMRYSDKPSKVESVGYTITIRKMLEYVNSKPASVRPPTETVEQVIMQYCHDECLLGEYNCVDAYASQEAALAADIQYCDKSNECDNDSDEWVYASVAASYISRFIKELPEKVGYLL